MVTLHLRARSIVLLSVIALLFGLMAAPVAAAPGVDHHSGGGHDSNPPTDKAVFFAADGMRQDLVEKYADAGLMPTMREFLRHGASATGGGLLTAGAAEHRRRLVHPRDRRVAGRPRLDQQHVPHQRTAVRRTGRRRSTPNVLQAESIAQSAERGGLKVAQVEWAGGRNATIAGPDDRLPGVLLRSRRRDELHRQRRRALFDDAPFIAAFGLQFDHPAGYAGQAPFPGAAPVSGDRLDGRPASDVQPARWRCACASSTSASTSTA